MSKVEQKKQQIILKVTEHLVQNGLSDVGLRTLAAVSGTSDRMLIYYFGTKDGLLSTALAAIAAGLAQQLDAVLGEQQRSKQTLIAELVALGDVPQFWPVIQLWFEVIGMAARGQSPYAENALAIGQTWLAWMESKLLPEEAEEATAVFAEVEGRLLLKLIGLQNNP